MKKRSRVFMIAIFIMFLPAVVNADFFELSGRNAWGISGDGNVVVGSTSQAFLWNEVDGLVNLGFLPGFDSASRAHAASTDGGVIVGYSSGTGGQQAFRWTEAGGMVDLGNLGGTYTRARGVSADGTVVVGEGYNDAGNTLIEAFRWTASGGIVGLGDLPGGDVASGAAAVSADGSVVVGGSKSANSNLWEAFRWTEADGMVGLGLLPGASESYARGISADGSVIVGSSGGKAFRWTAADGMVALDFDSAYDASSDGSVIVGHVRGVSPGGNVSDLAVRWTATGGTQTIRAWLDGAGITIDWRVLSFASSVSDDGCSVAGYGSNASAVIEAYLARVDAAGGCNAGVVDTYSIGGNVSGLTGTGLALQNNGADTLAIAADGPFTFSTELVDTTAYAVTVSTQPTGQTCSVTNDSGTIATADVTNVTVTCVTDVIPTYSIGGNVSGLTGTGLALQNNGADTLAIAADGPFTFSTELVDTTAYAVTVSTQPTGQTCSVTNDSGTIATADVTNVAVACVNDVRPPVVPPTPAVPIPTMSQWALITLSIFLGLMVFSNRKRLF